VEAGSRTGERARTTCCASLGCSTADEEDAPSILDSEALVGVLAGLAGACCFAVRDVGQTLHSAVDPLDAGADFDEDAELLRSLSDEYSRGLAPTAARLDPRVFRWSSQGIERPRAPKSLLEPRLRALGSTIEQETETCGSRQRHL